MSNDVKKLSPEEAQEALESVVKMEDSGWRRAVPDRWFGAGVAILIGSLFAVYALQDPYPYILFPILGLAIFISSAREKKGAYGRDFPSNTNVWAMILFTTVLLVVFFGSIVIRRTYDAAWVPLVAGLLVGLLVFWASEGERRAYLDKTSSGEIE